MDLLRDGSVASSLPEEGLTDLVTRLLRAESALDRLASSPSRMAEVDANDTVALLDSVRTALRDAREALTAGARSLDGLSSGGAPKSPGRGPDVVRPHPDRMAQTDALASRLLRTLVEVIPTGVIVSDAEGSVLTTNLAGEAILGSRVVGNAFDPVKGFTPCRPDGIPLPLPEIPLVRALRDGVVTKDLELLIRRADGAEIPVLVGAAPVRGEDGRIVAGAVVFQDISEQKRAQEAIRAREEAFRAIFESNALGIAIADVATGRFVRANSKLLALTGYSESELLAMTFVEATHPDDRVYADYERTLRGEADEWKSTRRYIRKDGSVFWAEAFGTVIRDADGAPALSMATVRDVTERRRVDEELRIALEKYRVLFDAFPMGITISDQDGQIVESNQEAESLLGISRSEHVRRRIGGYEWRTVRPDGTPMEAVEYPSVRALDEQQPVRNVEMGIVKQGGDITWISVTAAPIPLEGYGVAVVYGDITERKKIADALSESEARYRQLYDTSRDGLAATDLDGRYIECNQAYLDLLGYETIEDLRGRSYEELTPPEYHEMEARALREQVLVDGYCDAYEKEYYCRSGERVAVSLRAWLQRDASGMPSGTWALVRDISERKQAEIEREQLLSANRQQREFLERLIEAAPVGIAVIRGDDHRFELVNPTYLSVPGVPGASIVGQTVERIFPALVADGLLDLLDRVYETGEVISFLEYEMSAGPGEEWTYWNADYVPLFNLQGHTDGILVVVNDVTDQVRARKQVEQLMVAVDEQRSVLQTVMEHTQVQLAYLDLQFNFVSVNSAYARGSGYRINHLIGQNHFELFPHPENKAIFERVRDTGAVITFRAKPYEYPDRPQLGTTYWDWSLVPVKDETGQIQGLVLSLLDVTDRERAREILQRRADDLEREVRRRTAELQASEARLRAIFDNAALGIAVADLDGVLVETNLALQKMLGYTVDELEGTRFVNLTHPEDMAACVIRYREMLAGRRTSYQVENRYIRKGGGTIWALLSASLVQGRVGEPKFAVCMVEDITERKLAQEALLQAEKLTLTGRLAAGLAHEINNPLQSVIGCLALAEEILPADGEAGNLLHIAVEELDRTAGIVAQLRDVNRPSTIVERRPTDINGLLQHVMALIRKQSLTQGVDIVGPGQERRVMAMVAPDRIEQVFLNLMLNAVEAMPDGGRLEITLLETTVDDVPCGPSGSTPGGVLISFADTGPGIPEELLPHLFEPFHTSKADGLGLGLYLTHSIVGEHDGRVEVGNREGGGAVVSVWLPSGPVAM